MSSSPKDPSGSQADRLGGKGGQSLPATNPNPETPRVDETQQFDRPKEIPQTHRIDAPAGTREPIDETHQFESAAPPDAVPELAAISGADLSHGSEIGAYRIVGEIGRGGMGLVYVAEDLRLGRQIALKILPPYLAEDADAFRRFKGEARLLAKMNHPNIAIIHSLETEKSIQFLTMELISGDTLQRRISSGPLPVGEWFLVARQIASALEAAHSNGIIHLDLKPGNVMMTPDGLIKVLDFGLAMAPGRETDTGTGARTRARTQETIGGTPGYMSPEQVMGKEVDSRADIFAFGAVLFEAATGHRTFEGSSIAERMRATMTREPDLGLVPAEFPESVRDLIQRCLIKDANRRLASITQASEELDRALTGGAPAKTIRAPNNLPISLSNFVGRTQAKTEVKELLKRHPILTITGVGGGGKTRFVLEVARELLGEFPDGVWLVEIAPMADPSRVPDELLTVLGLKEDGGDPIDTLIKHLEERSTLLLLDGCEHFLEATSGLVNALLRRCARLRVLCTSREPLALGGEAVYQLPLLSIPRTGQTPPRLDELEQVEAIRLFVDRASAMRPGFALTTENMGPILQICRHLDGIPLAIELAAARVRVLSPTEIARRLDDQFRLLTSSDRGVLPHHQTLRALIDWSYDHLSLEEQSVLRRLAVFAGGWAIEAAERIGVGPDLDEWAFLDHLTNLVEKCLVEVDSDASQRTGHTRYRMLQTIRAYAHQKLREASEEPSARIAHRQFFLELAQEAEVELTGPSQGIWLTRLAEDHDNLLVAMEAIDPADDASIQLQLAGALGRYWLMHGHWTEARSIYARLLDGREISAIPGAAKALSWAGNLSKSQSDYPSAQAYLERSLELHRSLDDRDGIARSLHNLGNVVKDLGDTARARALYQEGLELQESLGNRGSVALSYNGLGAVALQEGDRALARSLFERSLEIRRELRSPGAIADSLNNLGWIAMIDGRLDAAVAHYKESLAIYRELGNRGGTAASLHNLGTLAERQNEPEVARLRYEESLAIHRDLGDRRHTALTLHGLAAVHQTMGDFEVAHALFAESAETLTTVGDAAALSRVLEAWAGLLVDQGHVVQGLRLLGQAAPPGPAKDLPSSDRWSTLRRQMGDKEFAQHYEAGRNSTPVESIAFARLRPGAGDSR